MDVKISILNEKEIKHVANLLPEMWFSHEQSKLISKDNLKRISVLDYIKKTLEDKNQIFFVAKDDGKVIGTIRCEIKKTPDFYKKSKEAYIDDLIIDKKFRNKGIATELVKSCIEWATSKGITLFTCKIWAFNSNSTKLFEKLGFKRDFSFYSLNKK